MVQVHKVKKKSFLYHECYVLIAIKSVRSNNQDITFMIIKDFFPCYRLHMLLAFYNYIQM